MAKRALILLLALLVILDIGYSFLQHYSMPFDGDMAGGIVPANDVKTVLENPLGLKVFSDHVSYPNPNRFFCHWSFYEYFNRAPHLFQIFTDPINSAYLSCALAKTLIQATILFLLAFFISGSVFNLEFWLAAVIITPLFQTNGYCRYMGIIDPATTYTFFYALPIILVLVYFLPLINNYFYHERLKRFRYLRYFWIPLALITSLSGPLNPGIALVVGLLLLWNAFWPNLKRVTATNPFARLWYAAVKVPKYYYFYLLPIGIFSMYSLLLGRFNSIDLDNQMPLLKLYARLPEGIFYTFFQKLGFPILLVVLAINTIIINKKASNDDGKKIVNAFKWIGIFSLVYILLLPLGGYRPYRLNVLRYDTIIPITLCLVFIFGKTTLFLIKNLSKKQLAWYVPLIAVVLFIFANADTAKFGKNEAERKAIQEISQSSESVVPINSSCTVLSWILIADPQESKLNSELLKRWGIVKDDKLYYQK
ncbi:MAG: hypothetical protein AB7S50_03640 [Bacteroidales bacterium]